MKKFLKGELGFLWFMAAFCAFWVWQSALVLKAEPGMSGGGAFPFACACVMLLMSLLAIWETRHYEKAFPKTDKLISKIGETITWLFPKNVLCTMLYVLIYALVLKKIGFLLATFFFLAACMITVRTKKPWKSVLIAAVAVGVIYVLFHMIFRVRLPEFTLFR
ncbi:MAG: tripartite tricarboxylate transporter TctB family protein [Clostridia bacterium]|nr:tripartite tricarboxylate transporter TctB family protein [Clostridia bacterium]